LERCPPVAGNQVGDAPITAAGYPRHYKSAVEVKKRHRRGEHTRTFILAHLQQFARSVGNSRMNCRGAEVRRRHHRTQGHLDRTPWISTDDDEFIHRFLLHVLPDGASLFDISASSPTAIAQRNLLCAGQQLLQMPPPTAPTKSPKITKIASGTLRGISLETCLLCRCGTMVIVEVFECISDRASILDSS
jgi:hypothetical protein